MEKPAGGERRRLPWKLRAITFLPESHPVGAPASGDNAGHNELSLQLAEEGPRWRAVFSVGHYSGLW